MLEQSFIKCQDASEPASIAGSAIDNPIDTGKGS